MICTFFGHRDARAEIKPLLREIILNLIKRYDVKQFYVGNQGNFDAMVQSLLWEIVQIQSIQYTVVLAYLPKKADSVFSDHRTILPEGIETIPPRFAIEYRNRWLIEHSDIVVTYVEHSFGGAAKFKKLAEKKGKIIIELSV